MQSLEILKSAKHKTRDAEISSSNQNHQQDQENSKKILIAKVISAHGVRGDVKLLIFSDSIANIEKYPLFDAKDSEINLKIKGGKKAKPIAFTASKDPIVLASFEGITDRNQAELIAGLEIYTKRQNFDELKKNEFYLSDLIGLEVIDKKGNSLGRVIDSQTNKSLTSLEIQFKTAALKLLPPFYSEFEAIPFKDEFFPDVNVEKGTIILIPPVIRELDSEEENQNKTKNKAGKKSMRSKISSTDFLEIC